MDNQNVLIKEWNQKLTKYMEEENYEKVDEVCRQLCRLQGLEPAEKMPDDFIHRLKKEESVMAKKKEKTAIDHYKKISKRAAGIAGAAAVFLLLGVTAGAAVLHNKGINIFEHGLSTAGEVTAPESESPFSQTNHVTEYRYEDYYTAALDAGFEQLLSRNYEGETFYYIYEHMDEDGHTTEAESALLSISGSYAYGNGSFSLSQYPVNEESTNFAVITNETGNNREYVSSIECLFALTDDRDDSGQTRTHTLVKCDGYYLTLEFIGMSEEEIHAVLETVRLNDNF